MIPNIVGMGKNDSKIKDYEVIAVPSLRIGGNENEALVYFFGNGQSIIKRKLRMCCLYNCQVHCQNGGVLNYLLKPRRKESFEIKAVGCVRQELSGYRTCLIPCSFLLGFKGRQQCHHSLQQIQIWVKRLHVGTSFTCTKCKIVVKIA